MTVTRPKLDPAVTSEVRRWLRSPMGAGLNPRAADAVIRSSLATILSRVDGNPLALWRVAWDLDRWATPRHRDGDDGGGYDLAGVLYEFAGDADETGTIGSAEQFSTRWRDVHGPESVVVTRGPGSVPTSPTRACGCGSCRWERPHPGAAA